MTYIQALYIHPITQSVCFIDFWTKNHTTLRFWEVIGLSERQFFALQEKCHQYWPAERSARYQYFVVDPMAEYNMPQYILREFKVTDARVSHLRARPQPLDCSEKSPLYGRSLNASLHIQDGQSRTVRQFQFTDWPEQGVPKSGEGFIDFIGQVHKTKEQFGQDGPITVHCR